MSESRPPSHSSPSVEDLRGAYIAQLFLEPRKWISRRVERVYFTDDEVGRRDVSVDLTLPKLYQPDGTLDYQPVPLTLCRKGMLVNFSLRNESGASLPLLNKFESGKLVEDMLVILARAALDPDPLPEDLQNEIRSVVYCPASGASQALSRLFYESDEFEETRQILEDNPWFRVPAQIISSHFLAFTSLKTSLGRRRIIHLSYEEQLSTAFEESDKRSDSSLAERFRAGLLLALGGPRSVFLTLAEVATPASTHVELEAPPGLQVHLIDARAETAGRRTTEVASIEVAGDADTAEQQADSDPANPAKPADEALEVPPGQRSKEVASIEVAGDADTAEQQADSDPANPAKPADEALGDQEQGPPRPEVAREERDSWAAIEGLQEHGSQGRLHLHFPAFAHRTRAVVRVGLWPRSSTVARTAFIASLFILAAILTVASHPGDFEQQNGEIAATLLLSLTGLSGLYLVRPSESPMAIALLWPLRVLAASPVGCAFIAALIVLGPFCSDEKAFLLIVTSVVALVATFLLGLSWWQISQASLRNNG
jgi:hypothetical protein